MGANYNAAGQAIRPLSIGKRPIVAIQAMDAGKLLDPFFAEMPERATGRKPLIEDRTRDFAGSDEGSALPIHFVS
jgi:hypothetical protein